MQKKRLRRRKGALYWFMGNKMVVGKPDCEGWWRHDAPKWPPLLFRRSSTPVFFFFISAIPERPEKNPDYYSPLLPYYLLMICLCVFQLYHGPLWNIVGRLNNCVSEFHHTPHTSHDYARTGNEYARTRLRTNIVPPPVTMVSMHTALPLWRYNSNQCIVTQMNKLTLELASS